MVVTVEAHSRLLHVIQAHRVIKSMPLKGTYDELMTLDRYVQTICCEAESEYRQYMASKKRYR